MNLKGKNIIITGAGRGIGRAIAMQCAGDGATMVLIARTLSELEQTAFAIRQHGGKSFMRVCDIALEQSVAEAVEFARENCGNIDVLVNNAGVQPPIGPFLETDIAEWKKNVEINLFGIIHCTKEVLPGMIQSKKGKIINLAGGGSTSPRPNFTAYAVSKTAIVRFTETLALELQSYNIDVNAVSPGAVNTGMLNEVLQAGDSAGKEASDAARRKETGGDDPKDAAELVCFLASDDSNGITGKLISAKWDPWREKAFQLRLKSDKDIATLRRIDDKNYEKRKA